MKRWVLRCWWASSVTRLSVSYEKTVVATSCQVFDGFTCRSTLVNWLLGLRVDREQDPARRKHAVTLAIVLNIGLLAFFKYANFIVGNVNGALAVFHLPEIRLGEIRLPIGISFYTFEAISYIVDVYRGRLKPERSLPNFLLFILFFPHLVAGPIVRARDFLPQIRRRKQFNWARAHLGVASVATRDPDARGQAAPTGRADCGRDHRIRCHLYIGVWQHESVVLAPAQRLDALAVRSAGLVDVPGDRCRAHEAHGGNIGVGQQRVDGHLVTLDH